jgi:uncharacterized glyoxalase superfamily protein PhnB
MPQAAVEAARPAAKPAEMSWLSPYLVVRDATKAVAFYESAFGFKTKEMIPGPDGEIAHAEVVWNGCVIMMGAERDGTPCKAPASSGTPPAVSLYVYCDDVDALHARATAAGAESRQAPANAFWGDRMCLLADPDGHLWCFATHTGKTAPTPGR